MPHTSELHQVLDLLAHYNWSPTELHETVMRLQIEGYDIKILYQLEEYPYYRTISCILGDHQFLLRLPRKREVGGVWEPAADVVVEHQKATIYSDQAVLIITQKLMSPN